MKNLSHKQIILIFLLIITAGFCAFTLTSTNVILSILSCILLIVLAIWLSESLKKTSD